MDANAWTLEVIFQMVGPSCSATPTLTCPSSEEGEEKPVVNTSCFPTDRQGRRHSHLLLSLLSLPSPLSSRYAFTSITPTFSSQSPLLWLAGLFSLHFNKGDKGGRVARQPPLPCREKGGGGGAEHHPFQSCKEQPQQKVPACKIRTHADKETTKPNLEGNKHFVASVHVTMHRNVKVQKATAAQLFTSSGSAWPKQRQPKLAENFVGV